MTPSRNGDSQSPTEAGRTLSEAWLDDAEGESYVPGPSEAEAADYGLVIDYLAGELSPADREHYENRMRTDPQFRDLAKSLELIWNLHDSRPDEEDLAEHAEAHRALTEFRRRRELEKLDIHVPTLAESRARRRWARGILASIGVIVAGWLGVWLRPHWVPAPTAYVHADAPPNADRSATLPDGTQVTLTPGSHLSYWKWWSDPGEHTLNLDGEGTFTVVRGARQPVIVAGPGVEVRAVEAQFMLHAFVAEPYADVEVYSGTVQVRPRTLGGFGEVLTLRAGERARVGPGLNIDRRRPPMVPHTSSADSAGATPQPHEAQRAAPAQQPAGAG